MPELLHETLTPAWTFPGTYGPLTQKLVVAGDRLIGVAEATIFAVDIYTGKAAQTGLPAHPSWLYSLDPEKAFYGGDPQVTTAEGIVYLMEGDFLVALRLADGIPLATWTDSPTIPNVVSIFAKGERIVVVSTDSAGGATLWRLAAQTGKKVFGPKVVSTDSPGPVACGKDALFFVAADSLNAFNTDFGDSRWKFKPTGDHLDPATAPLVAGDRVLVAGAAMYGVDLILGTQKFKVNASRPGSVQWSQAAADVPAPAKAATLAANFRSHPSDRKLLTAASARLASHLAAAHAYGGTAVATNLDPTSSAGEIVCFSLASGADVWRHPIDSPGAPTIIDGVVYVTTNHGSLLARFDYASGQVLGSSYTLPQLVSGQPAAIANGALHLTDENGNIVARPFATQAAAYFNGADSMVAVAADDAQFDFGVDDFTVEAWFRSSVGGEILSSYPTLSDDGAHGFRLNLTASGEIRVAVINHDAKSLHVGRTRATTATDGEWHHVALVRRDGTFVIVLDGISHDVHLLGEASARALAIGGHSALTIGAFVSGAGQEPRSFFNGLIREVRIWDRAQDITTIETNLNVELTGTEPRLRGLWRLDEVQTEQAPVAPRNAAARHAATARFTRAASRPTDLTMDRSAFPYLLTEAAGQWPYAGTWAARGEMEVLGSPAISTDGVVAFATDNVIYAVGAHDGRRVWSMDVSESTSEPVADGAKFLVLSEEESLIQLNAKTGAKMQLVPFAGMIHEHGLALVAPAVSNAYVAAMTGSQRATLLVWDRIAEHANSLTLEGKPIGLRFGQPELFALTATADTLTLTLYVIDPASLTVMSSRQVASRVFCSTGKWVVGLVDNAIVRLDARNMSAAQPPASALIDGTITGLVASADDNLVVAVTALGVVYGLTLNGLVAQWQTQLPGGHAVGTNRVNQPVLDGMGRVVCTTATGAMAVLDVETGALLGVYRASRPAIGTPAIVAGTVYTGCADSNANDADVDLDGAMHSIVFGETMVLRLNLDDAGRTLATSTQHAIIEAEEASATLHLLNVHESCVEAWVNMPPPKANSVGQGGGGIVGVVPTGLSEFDVNLWLDADGTVHYTSRVKDGTVWSGVHVTAATSVNDGKWHHLAVSRSKAVVPAPPGSPDRVLIYVDGVAVNTKTAQEPPAPTALLTGLKAYIGATVSDDLTAARPFRGMIAEVRLWDTYLESTEISSRMHVKLRGDEPDLIAYWNFDRAAIHDSARQGHDGILAEQPTAAAPVWWLTDLPFTQPAYPFITSAAAITSAEDADWTSYELSVKVCAADGRGMPKQDVHLWYVQHAPDDPASITVNTVEVLAVKSSEEDHPRLRAERVFVAKTGEDGTLKLQVTTKLKGHGPSLDMWTAFMPLNERFHVSVLLDNQELVKPAPPTLRAQTKLIQDYHYTTGNEIDHTRDRSTWRVIIRAADPNDHVRAKEPITLWASEAATIEVGGVTYSVNQENSVTLPTEMSGELTVVLPATDLTAPTLYARAGFMHRNDRIVIAPDQDSHEEMATMRGADLKKPRVTNWKKGGGDANTLIDTDYHEHADEIAQAVRQVTSSVTPTDSAAPARLLRTTRARLRQVSMASRGALVAMRQPEWQAQLDKVVVRRTLAGAPRPAPVNPDAFRTAMGGSLGFVFEKTADGGVKYTKLKTVEQVLRARGVATVAVAPPLLGNIFDDMWDGIKDVANTIYDAAESIAITIANTVQIAIKTLVDGVESIVHKVVATVKDAIDAVVGFFEQIMVGIEKLIAFLRAIFDWQAILDTHNILHELFRVSFDITKQSLKNTHILMDAFRMLTGAPKPIPAGESSMGRVSDNAGGKDSAVIASSNSVKGKSMTGRTTTTPPREAPEGREAPPIDTGDPTDALEVIVRELPKLASSILDLSPGDLVDQIKALVSKAIEAAVQAAGQASTKLIGQLGEPVGWALDLLDAPIYIPFISELYKWVTGNELSILDVLCLGLAIPVNLCYALVTLLHGDARVFATDAKGLPDQLRRSAGLLPLRAAGQVGEGEAEAMKLGEVPGTPVAPEIVLMVSRFITIYTDGIADMTFGALSGDMDEMSWPQQKLLGVLNIFQGVAGMVSLSMQRFESQPAYYARIRALAGPDSKLLPKYQELVDTIYSLQMIARAVKACAGVYAIKVAPSEPGDWSKRKWKAEWPLMVGLSVGMVGVLGYGIYEVIDLKDEVAALNNHNVEKQYTLLTARDLLGVSAGMFEWMFTHRGKEIVNAPMIYHEVMKIRYMANVAALVLHGVAVFEYGD